MIGGRVNNRLIKKGFKGLYIGFIYVYYIETLKIKIISGEVKNQIKTQYEGVKSP